jgi:hypothetical protein
MVVNVKYIEKEIYPLGTYRRRELVFNDGLHDRPPFETNPHTRKMVIGEVRGNTAHAAHQGACAAASQWYVFKEPEGWNLLSA